MSWVSVGVMAATTAASMYGESEKQENLEKYNRGQAEMTRYSPWRSNQQTGEIQQYQGPGMVGAGIGGAASGLAASQSMFGNKATPDMSKDPKSLEMVSGIDANAKAAQQKPVWAGMNPRGYGPVAG